MTVIDDGAIPNSRGSINVDDEGYPAKRNVLIENGILVGYMHDRMSAEHFGVEASGNGRRQSFHHMPLPRMTNTSLLAGKSDPEEIVRSVKRGIYAKRFSGGQVSSNVKSTAPRSSSFACASTFSATSTSVGRCAMPCPQPVIE